MARTPRTVLTDTVTALAAAGVSIVRGCALLGIPRARYYRQVRGYRHYRPVSDPIRQRDRHQPAALSPAEKDTIVEVILAEGNTHLSVCQLYWRSFDEGLVECSQSSFYRVAHSQNLVGDRRRSRSGGPGSGISRRKPVVPAPAVGTLWSWDITVLKGPRTQDRYLLYLVIDVYSRFPVAWRIEYAETAAAAVEMFTDAFTSFGAPTVLHADNGASMRSTALLDALDEQQVLPSYSRPRVSDDNPFSESLFKTIKYDLSCPHRFDSIDHARRWTEEFMTRYALEHRHSGLGRHTPASVFLGTAVEEHRRRQDRLDRIHARHPQRFQRRPLAPPLPRPTGINITHLSQTG